MENKLDFEGLASFLLSSINTLLPDWLPGGRIVGHEYECANLNGGHGGSCKVNIKTAQWADFASNDKGGDLISLYAAIKRIGQGEAYKQLSDQFYYRPASAPQSRAVSRETVEQGIMPPDTAGLPDFSHPKHGNPINRWVYRSADLRIMFFIARYNTADGKEFIPYTWSGERWQRKSWPSPRPLYGLELLAANPGKPVMIVEGEKACDAARTIGSPYVVVTWPGGSNAYSKVDWSPIYGRKVLMVPDNDQAGNDAMQGIARILGKNCPEIKLVNIPANDLPKGWDLADAVDDGWNYDKFKSWALPNVSIYNINIQQNNLTINNNNLTNEDDAGMPDETMVAVWERLGIVLTSQGQPICNEDNVARIFEKDPELAGKLWFDDFYNSVFLNDANGGHEMKDIDVFKLTLRLQRWYGLRRISDATVRRALVILADRVHKNEPYDWMESLAWDGKARIQEFFCTHLGAKTSPYVCAASKNFWISMVARIYSPGCIMRTMPILKSKQWAGKSTAFAIIGGKWYAEALESIQSNNFLQSLHGKMLIEFADMSGMDRADVNRIKQIISCRMDRFRAPYDRTPNDHMRRCVLVSTTNEGNFLRDDTGGSRFWPIETGVIDHDMIARDRAQLFAEAVVCFKAGEDWYKMPTDETEAIQEKYRQEDEWESIISKYLSSPNLFGKETTVAKIATEALHISVDKLDKGTQMRIARNLTVIGWEKQTVWRDGKTERVWTKTKINTEMVESYD